MLLLGDIGKLEVESERTEHARLPVERQSGHTRSEVVVRRTAARGPRQRTHALDVGEERLVFLLDEHLPEEVAEHANVPPERRVGGDVLNGHSASVGRNGRKTGQSFAQVENPR
jgi:hypothetical protein